MPPDQLLLTMLGIALLANVVLLALVPIRSLRQRRSSELQRLDSSKHGDMETLDRRPASEPGEPFVGPTRRDNGEDDEDARAAAAIEAFVAEVSGDPSGRVRKKATRTAHVAPAPVGDSPTPLTMPAPERPVHAGDGSLEGAIAGLADPATWDRTVREESDRVARFGRPVTVVIAELPQLGDVADQLGRDVADRVLMETARLLVSEGRSVDRIAWLGNGRFGVLLLETEEHAATGYVERVRAAADGWLESAGLSMRLSLGWASPAEGGDVTAAAAVARQRMHDLDRR